MIGCAYLQRLARGVRVGAAVAARRLAARLAPVRRGGADLPPGLPRLAALAPGCRFARLAAGLAGACGAAWRGGVAEVVRHPCRQRGARRGAFLGFFSMRAWYTPALDAARAARRRLTSTART
jgi:hypothetical protein